MQDSKLRTRSMDFAVSIINLVKCLKEKRESIISKNETGYWLELLYRTNYIEESEYKALDEVCASIRVMRISSIRTAKENNDGKR